MSGAMSSTRTPSFLRLATNAFTVFGSATLHISQPLSFAMKNTVDCSRQKGKS